MARWQIKGEAKRGKGLEEVHKEERQAGRERESFYLFKLKLWLRAKAQISVVCRDDLINERNR